jgi:tetratricopeptide (TPR) repeat protein
MSQEKEKRMKKKIFVLFAIFLLSSVVFAEEFSSYYRQGVAYYNQRNYKEAIVALQRAEFNHSFPEAEHYLGACYAQIGNFDKASYYYSNALELYQQQGNKEGIERVKRASHRLDSFVRYKKLTGFMIIFLGAMVLLILPGVLRKDLFILRYGEKKYFLAKLNIWLFVLLLIGFIFSYVSPFFFYPFHSLMWWIKVLGGTIFSFSVVLFYVINLIKLNRQFPK